MEFNPAKISKDLNNDMNNILNIINELSKKDLLKIDHIVDKNIHKETINLDSLYNKLAFNILDKKIETKNAIYDIYDRLNGEILNYFEESDTKNKSFTNKE